MRLLPLLTLFACIFLLFSCSSRLTGTLAADGSASLNVSMSLEPRITSLIRAMAAAGGQAQQGPVLDSESIMASMSEAPGIASVSLRNTSPSAIEGSLRISNVSNFISNAGFINFRQSAAGGSCQINISRENGSLILETLSEEISAYLNALMAPIASGERMTKLEYLELVSTIYSKAISDEIAASRIRASIDFPGTVTAARGGTFSGRRADFDIPLLDLLVLETPQTYEVTWR